jgi:hypothetical protein
MCVTTSSFDQKRWRVPLESRNQGLVKCCSNAQNKKGLMLEHQASIKIR